MIQEFQKAEAGFLRKVFGPCEQKPKRCRDLTLVSAAIMGTLRHWWYFRREKSPLVASRGEYFAPREKSTSFKEKNPDSSLCATGNVP